tara:strand:+ start:828 stop:2618 length:1791 start_codon:yes stop_codon:yes gene_type:complete
MKIFQQIKTTSNFISKLFFTLTLYVSTIWTNFYYISTNNVDFHKYYDYINYFLGVGNYIDFGQGVVYYFLISVLFKQYIKDIDSEHLELGLSYSIQNINLIFFIVGLLGIFKLLRYFEFDEKIVYLSLSTINFLPQTIYLRAVMKPEILGFAFFPWIILFFEKYLKESEKKYLIFSIPFFLIVVNTKASVAGIIILYFLIFYFKKIFNKIEKSNFLKLLIILLISLTALQYETYRITETSPFSRPYDESYDYRADLSIIYKVNIVEIFREPFLEYVDGKDFYSVHAKSIINLTILDTFGDHFNQLFDSDLNYFDRFRKNIFNNSSDSTSIYSDRTIDYSGPLSGVLAFRLDYLRKGLSSLFSILFYIFIFLLCFQDRKFSRFYASPFVGILCLIIISFGIPSNAFNPYKGDTIKAFYYSFLIAVSFAFVISYVFKKIKFLSYPMVILFIGLIFFIGGHPKENNQLLSEYIVDSNQYSIFCTVNNVVFFENDFIKLFHKSGNINNVKSNCSERGQTISVPSNKAFVNNVEIECLNGQNINENYTTEKACRDIIIYNVVNNNIVKDFYTPYFSLLILLTIFTIVLYESVALQGPVKPS